MKLQTCPAGDLAARRHYVLGVLTVVSFFNYMDRSVLAVLVEPIKADLHISDTQVGLLAGFTFAAFYASFGIPIARLADRSSRVRILSIAIVLWSLMTAASGLARSYWHLLLARVGVGVGEAGCVPASHSLITDYFPAKERAFAISVFQAGGLAGVTFGLAVAGMAAQALGWRFAFALLGIPGVLVALVAWLTVREPPRYASHALDLGAVEPTGRALGDVRVLLGQRSYRYILLGVSVANFVSNGIGQWMATFFVRVHGLSIAQVGLWLGASSGAGGILGILIGGAVSMRLVSRDRRWEVWLPAASAGTALPFYLATFLNPSSGGALFTAFCAAFVGAFGSGVGLASIQSVVPPRMRALGVALIMFASAFIGLGAGPFTVGLLSDVYAAEFGRESVRYALMTILLGSLASVSLFLLAGRSFRKDAQT